MIGMKAALVGICFLSLVPAALSGEGQSFGDWRYKTLTANNSQTHWVETFALTGEGGRFVVLCTKPRGLFGVVYETGRNMGKDGDIRKVTYKVDEDPPVKQQWKTLQHAIGTEKPIETRAMVGALMGGRKLIIQTYDSDYNRVRHTFSLDGVGDAIAHVLKHCPVILSGDWMYKTLIADDSQTHLAWTSALTGEKGEFLIWCTKPRGFLSVGYRTGDHIGKAGVKEVTYRVDKNPPVKQQWHSFGTTIGTEKPMEARPMADALIRGHELVIQIGDSDDNRVRLTFSLDGAGDTIARVLKHCKA